MDAPKVRKVLSSKPISIQAAHDLLARFLQNERQNGVLGGGVDEVLTRLEAVCHSLDAPQEITETDLKKAKKAAKRKRRSEESSGGSKKIKTR